MVWTWWRVYSSVWQGQFWFTAFFLPFTLKSILVLTINYTFALLITPYSLLSAVQMWTFKIWRNSRCPSSLHFLCKGHRRATSCQACLQGMRGTAQTELMLWLGWVWRPGFGISSAPCRVSPFLTLGFHPPPVSSWGLLQMASPLRTTESSPPTTYPFCREPPHP